MMMAIYVSWISKIPVMFFKYFLTFLSLFFFSISASAECFQNIDQIFNQGQDYFQRGQYLLSTQQFSLYSQLSCETEKQDKGRLRWAQSLFELNETEEGNFIIDKINSKSSYFSKAKIIRAWYQPSLVSSLSANEKKRFETWNQQIRSLPNQKIPWLAGTMSAVIPGLGQVYNGNYQSALFSFVLNALFLSATLELNSKNMNASAVASGVIFSIVYAGNITGTVQSSKAVNEKAHEDEKSELKSKMFPEL